MSENRSPLIIDEKACNGCGKCADACIMHVIEMRERCDNGKGRVAVVVNPDDCMFCEACVINCRQIAIMLNAKAGSSMIKSINEKMLKPKKSRFSFKFRK
ncbi:MAG TPA: 4Fe-4S dicluster domain-containing protein [Spirochaetota bacterium]|nr:4Fe-4S dicluster domain-containing protein [Spirochaetota bacterium]HPF06816.1 4Fe-4S dicluster domain-containing protein [Spirochaetota bacterium]HPJ43157.1 4Fe-4S dicluster domain-containing protein [Spirochaetota bacterium]HPR36389.1 4Fe-4S dicluster domain-containing protein [Spirochaetota bacterium]HRX47989.1 4Fe-4S dicluster domain-containing protein [Spirochaetota bacterium]